jgi:MFS family permease
VPAPTLIRDRLTWLTYGHFAVYGYFFYGFGPVVPLLRAEQHTSRGVAGLHGTALAVGGMLGGALTPWLVRRFSRAGAAWFGLGGLGVAVLGFGILHPVWVTIALAAISSMFGTLIANTVVATLSDHHGSASFSAISEANACNAAVGLVAPLVVGACVAGGLGWRPGLAVIAVLVVALAAVTAVLRVRAPAVPRTVEITRTSPLPQSYRLVWSCLVATTAVEVCLNLWVADELRTHAHAAPGTATAGLSAVVLGVLVGRLAGSRLLLRWPATSVLLSAIVLSMIGFAGFWLAPTPLLAFVGLFVLGVGDSMHFPLGIALAVSHSHGRPDLALSRASYATGLAAGIAPFAFGVVADSVGPYVAFLLVPLCLAVAAAIVWRLHRLPIVASAARGALQGADEARLGPRLPRNALDRYVAADQATTEDGQPGRPTLPLAEAVLAMRRTVQDRLRRD